MPGIFGNNVLKCSPLVYNSGTGVLPILVLIFVLAQYRGLVLEYCFFWCGAVLILVLKLSVHQIEKVNTMLFRPCLPMFTCAKKTHIRYVHVCARILLGHAGM